MLVAQSPQFVHLSDPPRGGSEPVSVETQMTQRAEHKLQTISTPTNLKLALLWASLMFLYIYNDYFDLYSPGKLASMAAARIGPFETNERVMVIFSMLLAIPALMIFASAILPPVVSRWANVFLGLTYTGVEALTLIGSRLSYQVLVCLEIVVTLLIIWFALRWPRQPAPPGNGACGSNRPPPD